MKDEAGVPHCLQRIASWPVPSTYVSGQGVPQPGQRCATYGSPLQAVSTVPAVPDAVTSEVTSIFSIRIAIASPTSAPSTATGAVTSWPPRKFGVIIGPQQPGAVSAIITPPSATGPCIGWLGPTCPRV